MSDHTDSQLVVAVVVTLAMTLGLTWLGLNTPLNGTGAYAPLATLLDGGKPPRDNTSLNAIALPTLGVARDSDEH